MQNSCNVFLVNLSSSLAAFTFDASLSALFCRASKVTFNSAMSSRTRDPPVTWEDVELASSPVPCPSIMHACRMVLSECLQGDQEEVEEEATADADSVSLLEGETVAMMMVALPSMKQVLSK